MKFAKTLALVACAGLLSTAAIGSARHAYAQDEDQVDRDGSIGDDSMPDFKAPPIDLQGCWGGETTDKNPDFIEGSLSFESVQDGKKLDPTSTFEFIWDTSDGEVLATGHFKGTVSSTHFNFKGATGDGCKVSGSAKGSSSGLAGKFKFEGNCKKELESGTFSISHGCF
jgi:hypothetical protein